MSVDAETLKALIKTELATLSDERVIRHIQQLLVEPGAVMRNWDYGAKGQQYPCWTVLKHPASDTGIEYCESGFGPRSPWGLVSFESPSMGMDSGWFRSFLGAYFSSFAATELPIWRVFKTGEDGLRMPITDQNTWDATWEHIFALRKADPEARYDCSHSISYS